MTRAGSAGAVAAGRTLRRLDRLGRVPAPLAAEHPLDGVSRRRLATLAAGAEEAEAALADALALLDAARGALRPGDPAAPSIIPLRAASRAAAPSAPIALVAPAQSPRRLPLPQLRFTPGRRLVVAGEGPPATATRPESAAPPAAGGDGGRRPPGPAAPAAGPVLQPLLSRGGRVGAATRVGLPAAGVLTGVGGPFAAPGLGEAAVAASVGSPPASRRHVPLPLPAGPPGGAGDGRGRGGVRAGGATAGDAGSTAQAGFPPAEEAAASTLAAPEGLAGLVSWWESREREPAAAGLELSPSGRVEWSVDRRPAGEGTPAPGSFEGSLAARQSLRGAIEEILVSEARASGIEVRP